MTIEIKNAKVSIGELKISQGELISEVKNFSYGIETARVEWNDISRLMGWAAGDSSKDDKKSAE